MIDLLVSIAIIGVCLYAIYVSRSKVRQALKHSLAQGVFEVDGSSVSGANLRLVKTQNQMSRHPGNAPSEVFCYCVGPGPSYYLAIAQIKRAWRRIDVKWVVQPLSEKRMREALAGDRKATELAFG